MARNPAPQNPMPPLSMEAPFSHSEAEQQYGTAQQRPRAQALREIPSEEPSQAEIAESWRQSAQEAWSQLRAQTSRLLSRTSERLGRASPTTRASILAGAFAILGVSAYVLIRRARTKGK